MWNTSYNVNIAYTYTAVTLSTEDPTSTISSTLRVYSSSANTGGLSLMSPTFITEYSVVYRLEIEQSYFSDVRLAISQHTVEPANKNSSKTQTVKRNIWVPELYTVWNRYEFNEIHINFMKYIWISWKLRFIISIKTRDLTSTTKYFIKQLKFRK